MLKRTALSATIVITTFGVLLSAFAGSAAADNSRLTALASAVSSPPSCGSNALCNARFLGNMATKTVKWEAYAYQLANQGRCGIPAVKRADAAIRAWLPMNVKEVAVWFGVNEGLNRDVSGKTFAAWQAGSDRVFLRMLSADQTCT